MKVMKKKKILMIMIGILIRIRIETIVNGAGYMYIICIYIYMYRTILIIMNMMGFPKKICCAHSSQRLFSHILGSKLPCGLRTMDPHPN